MEAPNPPEIIVMLANAIKALKGEQVPPDEAKHSKEILQMLVRDWKLPCPDDILKDTTNVFDGKLVFPVQAARALEWFVMFQMIVMEKQWFQLRPPSIH